MAGVEVVDAAAEEVVVMTGINVELMGAMIACSHMEMNLQEHLAAKILKTVTITTFVAEAMVSQTAHQAYLPS